MTPAFLRASIDGDLVEAERVLCLSLPSSWPDIVPILRMRLGQLEKDPALAPWLLRAIVRKSSGVMVGYIGFHTAPCPAYLQEWSPVAVEFGFRVFSAYRRQGYAREASLALMQWAHDSSGVPDFIVTVGRTNAASRALVSELGFKAIGSHIDEVDGIEDVYLRRIAAV
jgi:ribosomal-protein-alanine N-acetyltransferase